MKVIFVTGGVLSGIGKGITAASVGAILKASGFKVFMQKLDGYLNVDPGTMSPFQHGEVFVTDDGAETDLDLGHYERFTGENLSRLSTFTSGRLYEEIIAKERVGDYLGKTVQIVPHLTDLVKSKIYKGFEESGADISIVEIGGTVGDMENEYFIEAARQLRVEIGRENVAFMHVTLLPYLGASKELKTKPTQHAVRMLMSYGIDPDFLFVRSDFPVSEEILAKISLMCGIQKDYVIPAPTIKSIYEVPVNYEDRRVGEFLMRRLGLETHGVDMSPWKRLLEDIHASCDTVKIGMVGKYNDLEDAYLSLNEGLRTAGFSLRKKVELHFIDATHIEKHGAEILKTVDGICVPGGFGDRGIEGMVAACQFARENKVPYLGICLGSQIMAIDFARNILGFSDANSEEFNLKSEHKVVHIMESQKGIDKKGGTMRLGSYPCVLKEGTLAHKIYGQEKIDERHRHRFEFNNEYRARMEEKGYVISGTSPDGQLVELVEVADHPFMIGTQAHPEFKSRPLMPHPLFVEFVRAAAV